MDSIDIFVFQFAAAAAAAAAAGVRKIFRVIDVVQQGRRTNFQTCGGILQGRSCLANTVHCPTGMIINLHGVCISMRFFDQMTMVVIELSCQNKQQLEVVVFIFRRHDRRDCYSSQDAEEDLGGFLESIVVSTAPRRSSRYFSATPPAPGG
jgi:hypothetical protein